MSHREEPHPDLTLPHSQSLRWRLLTSLGTVLLVMLLAIGTSMLYFVYLTEREAWQGRQGEAARNAGEVVATFLQRMQDSLTTVGLLDRNYLETEPQVMRNLLQQNPALLEMVRMDANGHVIASASRGAPLLTHLFTISQSQWFLDATAGRLHLGSVQISDDNEPYLIIAIPAPDGGVIAGRLRMNVLWDVVADIQFGHTGRAYIVDQKGRIVAHTDPEVVLANKSIARHPELVALFQSPGNEGSGAYTNFEGKRVVGAIEPVPGTDWVVITELPQAEAFAISRITLQLLGGGMLLFGFLVMWVTVPLLKRQIFQPIENLRTGARRIGAGDLEHRIDIIRPDEIGQAAAEFNEMASHLRDREEALRKARDELERRVEERTAELSKSNSLLRQEIVERKQAEEALRESREHFRQVVSSITHHVYMTEYTPAGKQINRYISPNVEDLTGYPLEKFTEDWSFWPTTVIHPADRAAAAHQAARFARGQNSEMEYRLVRADGKIIWVHDSGRVEKGIAWPSLLVYGVVSDITERKRVEEALTRAHAQALEVSRLKSQLLANVSHDLRTPLNAILGHAEMLQKGIYGSLLDKQHHIIQRVILNTESLTEMVNKLMDQAQLEAGTLKLKITPFAPVELIERMQSTMKVLAETKGVQLTSNITADVPSTLSGDLDRLYQILMNLVGNAIKFTERGSVQVRIYRTAETHWAIQVSDTGPGIPPEAHASIFEPFWQVDGTATREYSGTGLGLSIVKQLTTMMGGQVILESQVGQGSTFTVLLPLKQTSETVS